MDSFSLLRSIKRRARLMLVSLPTTANADFMEIMNEVYENDIVPSLISFREEYYVKSTTWDTKQSQSFRIPSDSIGSKVRGLYLVDSYGSRSRPLPILNPDTSDNNTLSVYRGMAGVYLTDNTLTAPSTDMIIQVSYYRMPNTIIFFDQTAPGFVAGDKVYQVNTVSGSNLTLKNPQILVSTGTPLEYDIIHPEWPYDKKGSCTITFTAPFTGNPQTATYTGDAPSINDWLFLKGKSGFANMPREMYLYFVLATAAAILNSIGGAEFQQVDAEKTKQYDRVKMLLDPRNDGLPHAIADSRGLFDFV